MEAAFAPAHEMTFRQNENNLLILSAGAPSTARACSHQPKRPCSFMPNKKFHVKHCRQVNPADNRLAIAIQRPSPASASARKPSS